MNDETHETNGAWGRITKALRDARQATLELAAEEVTPLVAEAEGEYEQTRNTIEAAWAEAQEKAESHARAKLAAVAQHYAEQTNAAKQEYEQAVAALKAETDAPLARIAAQLKENRAKAARRRDDETLMIETAAESTLKGLHNSYAAETQEIAGRRQRLNALRAGVRSLLEAYRFDPGDTFGAGDLAALGEVSFEQAQHAVTRRLETLRNLRTPRLMTGGGYYMLVFVIALAVLGGLVAAKLLNAPYAPPVYVGPPVALVLIVVIAWLKGRSLKRRAREEIAAEYGPLLDALAAGDVALDRDLEAARSEYESSKKAAIAKRDADLRDLNEELDRLVDAAEQRCAEARDKIKTAAAARRAEIDQRRDAALAEANAEREQRQAKYEQRRRSALDDARAIYDQQLQTAKGRFAEFTGDFQQRWRQGAERVRALRDAARELSATPVFDWSAAAPTEWRPPTEFPPLLPFGKWRLDLSGLAPAVRDLLDLTNGAEPTCAAPIFLTPPRACSIFLQTDAAGRGQAIDALKAVMLRLLTSLPPGRARFTIFDPIGLGESFAGFMHLVDYEEALVGGRIWTEPEHFETRLGELTSHMENVIQKYLRNEFATIDDYNQQAGELAEPYRFLVIADFPANFSEESVKRLTSVVNSGARCGVFTLIAHDRRIAPPAGLRMEDITAGAIQLTHADGRFVLADDELQDVPVTLDAPPTEDVLTQILQNVGREARETLRVEAPFAAITPREDELWSHSSASELRVPLGPTGAVRLQHLRLGRGMAQHGLIAGKTGSGKSTLLHVIITNTALWYGPDEVEFYLVDFKKGVEFKTYVTNKLPHARAVAIESDREFGVSVLQRIDAEMARRGDWFRAASVQDIAAYREATGKKLPRTVLIVDEFQVFFSEDDKLAQDAALLLDRLVRQGRAFGIHVLLGSQSLGGAGGLSRSTVGQMAVRIALQCSETDSQLILDDTNVAARLLTRPGEAIYNDAGGIVEGNSPFQTAWLSDETRNEHLRRVARLSTERDVEAPTPVVFEGNAPADIRENRLLAASLAQAASTRAPLAWLGEPVAIKDPTNVVFRRQSGASIAMVGQRDEAALALFAATAASVAAQQSAADARFVVLDGRSEDEQRTGPLARVLDATPHDVQRPARRDVEDALRELLAEVRRRSEEGADDAQSVYLFVYGLQWLRSLRRQEDDFSFSTDDDKPASADKALAEILREGPAHGVHVVVWADTLATLERAMDRQTLGEFDNRVLFQMSAADSSNLIDSPEANRLGLYRALLYSEERGVVEKFRPYSEIAPEWLDSLPERFAGTAESKA